MVSLPAWLDANKMTQAEFGKLIGRSGATVSRIIAGKERPRSTTADLIVQKTGGAVTYEDLFSPAAQDAA